MFLNYFLIIKILLTISLLNSIKFQTIAVPYDNTESSEDMYTNGNDTDSSLSNNTSIEVTDALGPVIHRLESVINGLVSAVKKNQDDLNNLKQLLVFENSKILPTTDDCPKNKKPLNIQQVKCSSEKLAQNCQEVKDCYTGIYSIMIPRHNDNKPFAVACDLTRGDEGWTIIQRRQDGSTNFYRNWTSYVEGFGDLSNEFFIGLETLHFLTKQSPQELYIILEDFEGSQRFAKYGTFKIHSSIEDYKLEVNGYSGNAYDNLRAHNGQKFSTWDRDNDRSATNCAKVKKGGWWYNDCYTCNLNGAYLSGKIKSNIGSGISWEDFRGKGYSLKFVQMMIRPKQQ